MRIAVTLLLATAAWAQETPIESAERKLEAEDYAGAVADFTKAIEGAPGDARAYVGRGRALQMLDKDEAAIRDFSKAMELAPKFDARNFVLRAVSYLALEKYDSSIADCSKALEIDPRYAHAHYIRGEALRGNREDAAALKDFDEALGLEPRHYAAQRARGETSEVLRDFAGALADYTRLAALDPESPVAFSLRARTNMRLGYYKEALADFEAAFYTDDPKDPDRGLHVDCARAHLALGQKEEAEAELAKAAEPPEDPDAIAERGRFYYDTGRLKEAVADLGKAVRMDPKDQDYTRLFLFLARARNGEREAAAAELKAYADGRQEKGDWYGKVASFLTGQMKEDAFLAAAKAENPQIAIEQECEASWYAAAVHLLDGDAAGAKALLERCVATDVRTFIEYESARIALERWAK